MSDTVFDIMMYETGDGGDINIKNDDIEVVPGLSDQVYKSLFGGNIEQSTSDDLEVLDVREDWWGNDLLTEDEQFNSDFERTLNTAVLNSNGISVLENAADSDLEHLKPYADIELFGSIPSLNKFQLIVQLKEPDQLTSTKIKFVWDGTKKTLIENRII